MKVTTHRCLLSSLIESNDKQRQTKTHESFERIKYSSTATPKTQMTNRKSKQMSLVQVQQLIQ